MSLLKLPLRWGREPFTAEHGTGLARAPYIEKQLGPALEVMRSIKKGPLILMAY